MGLIALGILYFVLNPVWAGYVPEVVRELTWGDGPGEVGLIPEAEGQEPQGPGALAVGPQYGIYILDTVNRRIVKLGPDGDFLGAVSLPFPALSLCVDVDGRLYVLDPDRHRIAVYDREGTGSEYSYLTPEPLVGGALPITRILAYRGRVWLGTYRDVYPVRLQPGSAKVARRMEGVPGPSGMVYRVRPGEDGRTAYVEVLKDGVLYLELSVRSEGPLGTVAFLKEDGRGCVYVAAEELKIAEMGLQVRRRVLRYGPEGKLLDQVEVPLGYTYCYGGDVDVDRKGNIYHLWTLREGVRVVRWRLR